MTQLFMEYPQLSTIGPRAVAQLESEDDKLRHETDQPTIGLILCQTKDRILAEYALRDINKPIGVSDYELTRALPERLQSALPTIEEIEAELQSEVGEGTDET